MTPRTIKSGWKATSIMPYCLIKAFNSSQLQIQPQATSLPPSHTPKRLKMDPNTLYLTPKSQKDILFSIQHLDSFKKLNRKGRILLMKAGKALGLAMARKALQDITICKQQN